MFSRPINDRTKISLSIPQYAEELFELTDKDRSMLRQWLPWLDERNRVAKAFWRKVISGYTKGNFNEWEKGLERRSGPIWTFENR